ncbi:MAG: hypothetical protein QNL18_11195 [Pseudomonadales bacterium]|jgi:hypothetical protein|tara:strand:- start:2808 stop:3164 length:357 start_codon:yes stop_codon:yes gene_type:complete
MMGSLEYFVVWAVYLGFGVLFMAQLFALTAARSYFTKVMIRGHFMVLAFTPAEIAEFPGHYAPAVLTLAMDVLLKGAATTFAGGFILLVAYLAMLASTGVYGLVGRRQNRVASESAAH